MVVGILFTYASLLVLAVNSTEETATKIQTEKAIEKPLLDKEDEKPLDDEDEGAQASGQATGQAAGQDGEKVAKPLVFAVSQETIFFQLFMLLSSVYLAMLLTNWGDPASLGEEFDFFPDSYQKYWINMGAMWAAMAIYVYSLTAPYCMDRNFGE